jgi:hypothetical protein
MEDLRFQRDTTHWLDPSGIVTCFIVSARALRLQYSCGEYEGPHSL